MNIFPLMCMLIACAVVSGSAPSAYAQGAPDTEVTEAAPAAKEAPKPEVTEAAPAAKEAPKPEAKSAAEPKLRHVASEGRGTSKTSAQEAELMAIMDGLRRFGQAQGVDATVTDSPGTKEYGLKERAEVALGEGGKLTCIIKKYRTEGKPASAETACRLNVPAEGAEMGLSVKYFVSTDTAPTLGVDPAIEPLAPIKKAVSSAGITLQVFPRRRGEAYETYAVLMKPVPAAKP